MGFDLFHLYRSLLHDIGQVSYCTLADYNKSKVTIVRIHIVWGGIHTRSPWHVGLYMA
jgi:hypothetical protein